MKQATPSSSEGGPATLVKLHGILNVDKPPAITTMDVVRRLKRASGQKRVGHGGTLDPVATGVVPVFFGHATRVMEYLINSTKDYRTEVELGVETDTYDSLGSPTKQRDASSVTADQVEQALESFRGTIHQVPPMFSALKRDGKRLYDLARSGIEVEREARVVEVQHLEMVRWDPPIATLEIRCGRGFYVRSLAHDLGQTLGCGGHMKSLVRQRSGPFRLSEAQSLEDAMTVFEDGDGQNLLRPPDVVLGHLRAVIADRGIETLIRKGQSLPPGLGVPVTSSDEKCRLYTVDGRFIAVISFDTTQGRWHPDRVFAAD